jgi:SRSO17 transposase
MPELSSIRWPEKRITISAGLRTLLLDESAFAKKGEKSVGVARQWNGQLGKVENSQVAVFAALQELSAAE